MLKKILLLLFVFINIYSQSTLKERIKPLLSKVPKGTIAAVEIIDVNTGETIFENEAQTHVIPASNAKLFSTATALSIMGVNYEYETRLLTDDKNLADNIINGNLYIQGLGNSLFSESDLDDFVNELKKLNITEITGDIIGDDSIWDNNYFRQDWIEGEVANVSVPAVSALVLNKNLLTVNISGSSKVKGRAIVSLNDSNDFIEIKNSCTTVKRKGNPNALLNFSDGRFILNVTGSIGRNLHKSVTVKVKNPAFYTATVLFTKIRNMGITINGNREKELQ
ncbi:MAG TPA: D-alanyl-D-alanine carboxypeptidase [Melioribacteraceae bacterium]|nr:D-alanyl-D-alanine carboxypeptidase [Melioribacteraceae bacterium]